MLRLARSQHEVAETLEEKSADLASSQDPHHPVASKANHLLLLSISLPTYRMGRKHPPSRGNDECGRVYGLWE